jgi:DNA-binding SARP family transcriptional activator
MASVAVSALGPLRVAQENADGHAIDVHGKLAALLALIAVERRVSREQVVEVLWDGVAEESARHSLRQSLVRLKHTIGDALLRTEREVIEADDALWCDVTAFDRAVRARRPDEAMSLYRGAFLSGFDPHVPAFEQWRTRRGAAVAVHLRNVARQLIAECVEADRLDDAVRWARRWAHVSADEDEAQHRLIELLAALGRRSEAIEHFELYRAELARFDLTPLDETAALVEQIRNGVALGALTTMVRHPLHVVIRTRRFGGNSGSGPRLIRIVEGGIEAESHYLNVGANRIGRSECEVGIPFDAQVAESHASIEVVQTPEGITRLMLKPDQGPVFLRIYGEWPLRDGDRFRAGREEFRIELT